MNVRLMPVILTLLLLSPATAEIQTKTVEYQVGEQTFEGFLAWDDAKQGKQPSVIVVHEWWGRNEYADHRAKMLAKLGYVAFAIDMFGKGKTTSDVPQAQAWAGECYGDPKTLIARFSAGLETLKKQEQVDSTRIAAIGYCFGGMVVLSAARADLGLKAVVSFHGSLQNVGVETKKPLNTRILVCHGEKDPFIKPEDITAFNKEMTDAQARMTFISYPDAVHSFTNPRADEHKIEGVNYNQAADVKSWDDMKQFLAENLRQP